MTENEANNTMEDENKIDEKTKKLIKEKLDPILQDIVTQTTAKVPLIVQTPDGLKDEDKELVEKHGGKVKDNLYIINAFSAEIATDAVLQLIKNPRIVRIYYDSEVRAL